MSILVDRLPGAPYNPLSAAEVEQKFLLLEFADTGRAALTVDRGSRTESGNLPDVAQLAALVLTL